MAPEVINGAKYTQQADIWSYGMLLYEIITLQAPYSEESNHEEM
jgi:serine/threonine protein kinase